MTPAEGEKPGCGESLSPPLREESKVICQELVREFTHNVVNDGVNDGVIVNLTVSPITLFLLSSFFPLRYGPWYLLCKGRSTEFPVDLSTFDEGAFQSQYESAWLQYADHGTVESAGLIDGMQVMFEYAVVGKDGFL